MIQICLEGFSINSYKVMNFEALVVLQDVVVMVAAAAASKAVEEVLVTKVEEEDLETEVEEEASVIEEDAAGKTPSPLFCLQSFFGYSPTTL